jgi:hypothetical protein
MLGGGMDGAGRCDVVGQSGRRPTLGDAGQQIGQREAAERAAAALSDGGWVLQSFRHGREAEGREEG